MARAKITKENVLENEIRKKIYLLLKQKPLTVYDLTQKIYELSSKRKKFVKKLYDKVKYHTDVMLRVGALRVEREKEVRLVEPKEDGKPDKKPITVTKVWYKSVPL